MIGEDSWRAAFRRRHAIVCWSDCSTFLVSAGPRRGALSGGIRETKVSLMNRSQVLAFLVIWLSASVATAAPTAVSFKTTDHVTVFADYYTTGTPGRPLVLLFHQAGSNRAEYATIAPRLLALGFDALAIDQRSGGSLFGRGNETVQRLGHSEDYGKAYGDLEAAFAWAQSAGRSGPVILWRSSYSAALVFLLAAKHQKEVKALLAFSPGEFLGGASSVRKAAAQL